MNYIEQQVRVYDDGTTRWYFNGKLHRVDGPAVETANGYKAWYFNGKTHREDGPAVEKANGFKSWYLDDKRHREEGPAIEFANGSRSWYLYGVKITEEEHAKRTGKETDTSQMEELKKRILRLEVLINK